MTQKPIVVSQSICKEDLASRFLGVILQICGDAPSDQKMGSLASSFWGTRYVDSSAAFLRRHPAWLMQEERNGFTVSHIVPFLHLQVTWEGEAQLNNGGEIVRTQGN